MNYGATNNNNMDKIHLMFTNEDVFDDDVAPDTYDLTSDFRRSTASVAKEGFREGAAQGREIDLQKGFDEGYEIGTRIGALIGALRLLIECGRDLDGLAANQNVERLNGRTSFNERKEDAESMNNQETGIENETSKEMTVTEKNDISLWERMNLLEKELKEWEEFVTEKLVPGEKDSKENCCGSGNCGKDGSEKRCGSRKEKQFENDQEAAKECLNSLTLLHNEAITLLLP